MYYEETELDATYDRTIKAKAIKRLCDRGHAEIADKLYGRTRIHARAIGADLNVYIYCTLSDAVTLAGQTMTYTGLEMPGPLDDVLEVTLRRWPSQVFFIIQPPLARAA
jgi:hypothetical protein